MRTCNCEWWRGSRDTILTCFIFRALEALRKKEISANKASKVYKIPSSTLYKIARKEGVPALYAGLLPNYLKLIPAAAISFLVYEQLKERMQLS